MAMLLRGPMRLASPILRWQRQCSSKPMKKLPGSEPGPPNPNNPEMPTASRIFFLANPELLLDPKKRASWVIVVSSCRSAQHTMPASVRPQNGHHSLCSGWRLGLLRRVFGIPTNDRGRPTIRTNAYGHAGPKGSSRRSTAHERWQHSEGSRRLITTHALMPPPEGWHHPFTWSCPPRPPHLIWLTPAIIRSLPLRFDRNRQLVSLYHVGRWARILDHLAANRSPTGSRSLPYWQLLLKRANCHVTNAHDTQKVLFTEGGWHGRSRRFRRAPRVPSPRHPCKFCAWATS